MKKIISYLLIIILPLCVVGCSKEYSSSTIKLKQQYIDTFPPSFASEAEGIAKKTIDLYNKAIVDNSFESSIDQYYTDFKKFDPKDSKERDLQDYINSFSTNYAILSLIDSLIKNEQNLRDNGSINEDDYNVFMEKYKLHKTENIKKVKLDLDNIMKYYEQ